jgi:hypothetical protein
MTNPRVAAQEKAARIYSERLQFHLDHPEASSPTQYLHARELALGKQTTKKIRVYLDTKFWVLMREHRLGRQQNPEIVKLHDALVEYVGRGEVICPVSAYSVGEVQLQTDEQTRHSTAQLMDELSTSVVMHKEETRIPLEVREFLENSLVLDGTTCDLAERIWTRPLWMIYPFDPGGDDSPPKQRLAAKKASIDAAWECTILDLVSQADGALPLRVYSEMLAPFLNEEKPTPVEKIRTFKQVFLGQLINPLEVYAEFIEGVFSQLFEDAAGTILTLSDREHQRMTVGHTIFQAFEQDRVGRYLPFFRILPSILSMYVIDRERRYKVTDFYDFYHAAVLPYTHIYVTEKSMAHLLTSKPLSFDRLYDTRIVSRPSEALETLRELVRTGS